MFVYRFIYFIIVWVFFLIFELMMCDIRVRLELVFVGLFVFGLFYSIGLEVKFILF